MVTWIDFTLAAPELAAEILERFERTGLCLLGTIRRDGYPRISPVEPLFLDSQLYLGMMFRSTKAMDLYREPHCVVHSVVSSKDGTDGEAKLYGQAKAIHDPDERDRYGAGLYAKIGWRPDGDFDLFALDIEQVAFQLFGAGRHVTKVWRPGSPVRQDGRVGR